MRHGLTTSRTDSLAFAGMPANASACCFIAGPGSGGHTTQVHAVCRMARSLLPGHAERLGSGLNPPPRRLLASFPLQQGSTPLKSGPLPTVGSYCTRSTCPSLPARTPPPANISPPVAAQAAERSNRLTGFESKTSVSPFNLKTYSKSKGRKLCFQ